MKKFLLFSVAVMTSVFMMAAGTGDGSTKANAIEFSWEDGHVQTGSQTLWYRVSLDPLYQEDIPTLTLHLTSLSLLDTVVVTMDASIAGQSGQRTYTFLPGKHMSWSANATSLVRMKATEVFLKLTTTATSEEAKMKLTAQVYDAIDLDEACKEAKPFNWSGITQAAGVVQWFKVNLKAAQAAEKKDVKIAITNNGSRDLHLRAGQSLDCPSSGLTKRSFVIASGKTVFDTIPASMIKSVSAEEIYVTFDNDQPIAVSAELIDAPSTPIYENVPTDLHVESNQTLEAGPHFFRISVQEMNDSAKYEPEFTFRNTGLGAVKIVRKMSFENPVYGWQTSPIEIPEGEEVVEVIKKNVVEGIDVAKTPFIYVLIENDKPFQLVGRYKHVREGKACKSNIDYNWEKGHSQEGKTTQWYAVDVKEAKKSISDIRVTIENIGFADATIKGAVAFSCPYIDLQEATRTVKLGKPITSTIGYSSYAMMTDTIWIGVTTDQDIRFFAELIPVETKPADPNDPCLEAKNFDWDNGQKLAANTPQWYKVDLRDARALKVFPTAYITNLSATNEVTINAELSLECPDTIPNQTRTVTIEPNGVRSQKISRNLFENIKADSVYIRVEATQDIFFELRMTEEAEGSSCTSAIRFNWSIGNDQKANDDIWYSIDLETAIKSKSDIKVTIVNKENKEGNGTAALAYSCIDEVLQKVNFNLGAKESVTKTIPYSSLEMLNYSVVYIELTGNTALHIEAELVPAEKLPESEQVKCEDLADAVVLDWDTEFTQNGGSAWYKLDKAILDSLISGEKTAEAHIWNEAGAELNITGEIAFSCPVEYKMASKTITLKSDEDLVKAIEANTAQQFAEKEAIYIRLSAAGKFKFAVRLISTWTGIDRDHALRVKYNEEITQAANTTMWYRINSEDLKDIENIDGARLYVEASMPEDNTTVEVAVFEENSKQDMIEYYTGRQAKHTFGKAHSGKHYVPAYVVRALADKVLYLRVKTNKPLSGKSVLSHYKTRAEAGKADINVKELATLAVPNVKYSIPAGGRWFAICLKDLRDNFVLTRDAGFTIKNPNSEAVTVSGTATWQEVLTYDIPYRTRTIDKGVREYSMTFIEAIEKAARRKIKDFSLDGIDPALVDSFAREYVTDEHLAAYIYFEHNGAQPLELTIKLKPTTGDAITNAIEYDWEHGNVNPGQANVLLGGYARAKNWYMVELDENEMPADKDLELQVSNWSDTEASTTKATIKLDTLSTAESKTIEVEIPAGEKKTKRIDRSLLAGASNVFIEFESSQANYIWAEFVDTLKRDTFDTYVTEAICLGHYEFDSEVLHFESDLTSELDTIKFEEKWEIVRNDDEGIHECDSIVHHTVFALRSPELIKIKDIDAVVYTDEATKWLKDSLNKAHEANDTVKAINAIVWQIATNDANTEFKNVPEAKLKNEAIVLRYGAITECENDTLFSGLFYNIVRDTLKASDCYEYKWAANDSTYYVTTLDSIEGTEPNGCKSIHYLDVTIKSPIAFNVKAISKFGNRLLVIDRDDLDAKLGFKSDSIYAKGGALKIEWYEVSKPETIIAEDYFFNDAKGAPLVGTFQAKLTLKIAGAECDKIGFTNEIVCKPSNAAAPALVPNLVMPGENINVINLDPTKETMIRIYATDGMLRATYIVRGQETFTMPAAADHGFYLVELNAADDLKTTLRYIVK